MASDFGVARYNLYKSSLSLARACASSALAHIWTICGAGCSRGSNDEHRVIPNGDRGGILMARSGFGTHAGRPVAEHVRCATSPQSAPTNTKNTKFYHFGQPNPSKSGHRFNTKTLEISAKPSSFPFQRKPPFFRFKTWKKSLVKWLKFVTDIKKFLADSRQTWFFNTTRKNTLEIELRTQWLIVT